MAPQEPGFERGRVMSEPETDTASSSFSLQLKSKTSAVARRLAETVTVVTSAGLHVIQQVWPVLAAILSFVRHGLDIINMTLRIVKYPIAFYVTVFVAGQLSATSLDASINAFQERVALMCAFPVLAQLPWCPHVSGSPSTSILTNSKSNPPLITMQNLALKELSGPSSEEANVALDLKHAELAVRDLIVAVNHSNLTVRQPLAVSLEQFVLDARAAGRELQKLSARVLGLFDRITAFQSYALQSQGGDSIAISRTVISALHVFSSQISPIISEAASAIAALDALEDHLHVVHTLCHGEALTTGIQQDDMLWELWSMLGGNQERRRDLAYRMDVLRDVQRYRGVALGYVAATLKTLTWMDAQLAELREALAMSRSPDFPVMAQLAGLERMINRLQQRTDNNRLMISD